MEANPVLFRDLTYIFLAAVFGGLAAWRLKLPLILGFVLGGIVISPFTPGPHLSDLHTFEVFAEVGVVLLMFSIGVDFSIPDLMRVKWIALGGGTLGILFSLALALGVSWLIGWTLIQGFVIGATISVASTMVLARLLTDCGALGTEYGRVMIGITLVEDIAVVFMTIIIPIFSGPSEGRFQKAAWTLGKAALLLIPLVFLAMTVVPARPAQSRAHQRPRTIPACRHRHLPRLRRRSRKPSASQSLSALFSPDFPSAAPKISTKPTPR